MQKQELIDWLVGALKQCERVVSAGQVDGEDAIGVETQDGVEYFIEVQDA